MALIRGTNHSDVITPDMVSPGVWGGAPTADADTVQAGNGDDTVRAGSGNDALLGGNGDDQLWGEAGWDWLDGGNGNDRLHGGSEGDELSGGPGDDRLWGDGGDDRLWGGPGTDEATYAGARSDYAVAVGCDGTLVVRDLNGGADGIDEGTDTLQAVERLRFLGGSGVRTFLASTAADGEQGNDQSFSPSLSADGTKLAFASAASNLVAGDTAGTIDIFLKDLSTGEVTRIAPAGEVNGGGTDQRIVSLSADGTKLAFLSMASELMPEGTNWWGGIFVADLASGTITRADASGSGADANAPSSNPAISADGGTVAFSSFASNLTDMDTGYAPNIFVKDVASGEVTLASTSADGQISNAWSAHPSLSADGSKLAFSSYADTLVPDDTNGAADIFVKDLTTGALVRASTSASGGQSAGPSGYPAESASSYYPWISADGSKVAFSSFATNLVPGDTNGTYDVFIKDLASGAVTRVSTSGTGAEVAGGSEEPVLSADGHRIAFQSVASDLVPGDSGNTPDIFIKDLATGEVTRVSGAATAGREYAFSEHPSLSAEGSRIAFESYGSDPVPGDTNGTYDIFVADLGRDGGAAFAIGPGGTLTPLGAADDIWG